MPTYKHADGSGREISVRASDAEREHVVALLNTAVSEGRLTVAEYSGRVAAVYATQTRDELDGFTDDLPSTKAIPTNTSDSAPIKESTAVGAIQRNGHWRVPSKVSLAVAIGPIKLDFRDAHLTAPEVVVNASVTVGSIKIVVPQHVRLIVEGSSALGTRKVAENYLPDHVPAPTIRLRLNTAIGTVKVHVDDGRRDYSF